jgi:hypothetical protein
MSTIRLLIIGLLFAWSAQASAQREPMPLRNFIDLPVPSPSTAARVKSALVRGALWSAWSIVEDADGSLIATRYQSGLKWGGWRKTTEYDFMVRINYDATKYSVRYLDSANLGYRRAEQAMKDFSEIQRQNAANVLETRYQDSPETPYAVASGFYIRLEYEDDVRRLLTTLQRYLLAPAP